MSEMSMFERRLAAELEAYAGPRRSIDAIAIARTAASRVPVRRSVLSLFSAWIGQGAHVRGRRLGDLVERRSARPLMVLIAVSLITALAFGALAVGSGLVRLPSVVPPLPVPTSSAGPSSPQPSVTSVSIPPAQPAATWTATGPMAMDREDQTATLLLDGTVLVAGGGNAPTSAELYDPKVGTWMTTGSMTHRRIYETATLLADGRVLVAGGDDDAYPLSRGPGPGRQPRR
jgi:hypothetical protein